MSMMSFMSLLRRAYGGLPMPVYAMAFASLVWAQASMSIMFMSLYLTQKLGMPVAQSGRLLFFYGLGAVIGSFSGGILSERCGAKFMIIGMLLLGSMFFWVLIYSANPAIIGVCIFFIGTLNGTYRPCYNSILISICSPATRAKAHLIYLVAVNLGTASAGALGGYLAGANFRDVFVIDAVLSIFTAGILFVSIPKGLSSCTSRAVKDVVTVRRLQSPYADLLFLLLCFSLFICAFVEGQSRSTYGIYLTRSYGMSLATFGLLFTYSSILSIFVQIPATRLIERGHHGGLAAMGAILLTGGFTILPLGNSVVFAFMSLTVWSFGEMIFYPTLTSIVMSRAERGRRGHYLGIYHCIFPAAVLCSAPIGTAIYAAISPNALWYSCGLLGLVAAGVIMATKLSTVEETPPEDPV